MSIVMTGGGTGGHLAIIKAVKEHLKDEELIYIGSTKGQDQAWFEKDPDFLNTYFLETRGVVNQGVFGKVGSLWKIIISALRVRRILRRHQASVVFSVGGFSAAPAALAAKLSGVPLVIHEQNAALGSLNRLLKPYADMFTSSYLEESPVKAYPVKEAFFDNARIRTKVETVIFLGGSQGAKAINDLALKLAPSLKEKKIRIIHQAGSNKIDEVKEQYRHMGIEADVFGFTAQMAAHMKEADFAIARAGASTLWELSATALPTLFIPFPSAAGDHQYYNAKFLADQGLAWLKREDEIEEDEVLALLDEDMTAISKGLTATVEKEGSEKTAALLKGFQSAVRVKS
ncbi:MAG: undecaprenyldiphospho-muramoylpentapeptide beta-N-acetylglucosaminyltransferase [Sulfurimonas sp.]